ncbi:MAG: hypothetical protein V3T51_05920 [Gammaproteobacteria bacterium]
MLNRLQKLSKRLMDDIRPKKGRLDYRRVNEKRAPDGMVDVDQRDRRRR